MKKLHIKLIPIICLLFTSCTDWGYIDTGLADGSIKGNMYQYMQSDSYNWDSIRKMIVRADMVEVFEGKDANYKSITFFGPTNHAIRKWMWDVEYKSIDDISKDSCVMLVKMHILKEQILRDDFPRGAPVLGQNVGTGGKVYTLESGNNVWIYSFREPYNDIPDTGPVVINMTSQVLGLQTTVISSNILTTSGVMQALSYKYQFPKLR